MEIISDEHSSNVQLNYKSREHPSYFRGFFSLPQNHTHTLFCPTLMKSLFLDPYSSNSPRGAELGTNKMDLKVTSPSAVKWMYAIGSSCSCEERMLLIDMGKTPVSQYISNNNMSSTNNCNYFTTNPPNHALLESIMETKA